MSEKKEKGVFLGDELGTSHSAGQLSGGARDFVQDKARRAYW